ncbi:trace amine-associated receptor 13c-like [Synchiropus splendidus]|uniref:trace amine-associated receptor 13c-like n=1 Tax=Synchiropus splendidus TaxID=270530 RepID=UPI00237E3B15|nr:trace amine-associated receptor 13c-like [Synchiropus splendidus]
MDALCQFNSSCRALQRPHAETAFLYSLLAFVSLLTVALNLLVIVSISNFRQLHTPTNMLLLSLAASDLLVGLLVMPIEGVRTIESCWVLGRLMCVVSPFISYSLLSATVGNVLLISINRYLAICDPLRYSSKVTLRKVKLCVCLSWACSSVYNCLILKDHLGKADQLMCHGECVMVVSHIAGTVDLVVTFFLPCAVILVLNMKVCVTAMSHIRLMRSSNPEAAAQHSKRSERKAARTLGVVIAVFLVCFCPYFYPTLLGHDISSSSSYFAALSWVMMLNSSINPLIYALFYPWFRKAVKLICTLQILLPNSRDIRVL